VSTVTSTEGGAPGAATGRRRARGRPRWLGGAIGVGVVLGIWEVLAVTVFAGRHILPTPTAVAAQMWRDRSFYWPHIKTTVGEAAVGYVVGNVAAIVLAVVFLELRAAERVLMRLAIVTYNMPILAIGPILQVVLSGNQPKEVLAGMAVFFTTLIGTLLGLRSADNSSLDLVRAYGGGRWAQFRKVRVRSALPSTFAALKIAAPAALLGAIIGEYLGGQQGLGVAMINSEETLDVNRTWGIALVATAIAGLAYFLTGLIGARLSRWATERPISVSQAAAAPVGGDVRGPWLKALRAIGFVLLSVGVVVALWYGGLQVLGLSHYFAKSPADVWNYVFNSPDAAANRHELLVNLGITLRDAGLGYAAGTIVAVVTSAAIVLWPAFEQTFMPVAVALRAVPLVAMTPLIALVFGRGLAGVMVVAGIVTFFPTLVNVVYGLRSSPRESLDLFAAYGARRLTTLIKVQFPFAMPSLFASARISAPGALLGALLAEWLATGQGLGNLMLLSTEDSRFGTVWASVVLITLVSAAIYALVSLIEAPVLTRYAPEQLSPT